MSHVRGATEPLVRESDGEDEDNNEENQSEEIRSFEFPDTPHAQKLPLLHRVSSILRAHLAPICGDLLVVIGSRTHLHQLICADGEHRIRVRPGLEEKGRNRFSCLRQCMAGLIRRARYRVRGGEHRTSGGEERSPVGEGEAL